MSTKTDKRAKKILYLLLQNGKASVEDLVARTNTSPASIRRDLVRLEEQGLVHRTHGGAMLAEGGTFVYEPFRFDATFQERAERFSAEKQRIARAAAMQVEENETVGITAGTTCTFVARQLAHRKSLHIITNALNIGMELNASTRLQVTLTGGCIRWIGAFSLVGPTAVETLSHFVMDKLFVSATGVDPEHGATIIQPEEAGVFRAMVRQAKKRIVIADSSKLGQVSPAVICTPSEIDLLITDDGISEDLLQQFAAKGVSVLTV